MTGSRLQVMADFLSQSLNSGVPPCHHSAMYEYAMDYPQFWSSYKTCLIRVYSNRVSQHG